MQWKQTLGLWKFGIQHVPLIFVARPSVLKINKKECEIKIPLNYWTSNHLKSMYFGALCIGADCAGGLIAFDSIQRSKKKVQLVFKDLKAEFLKRPEADVHFYCGDGDKIQKQIQETIKSGERVNRTVRIIATTPSISQDEPVATFDLTLSLKARQSLASKNP